MYHTDTWFLLSQKEVHSGYKQKHTRRQHTLISQKHTAPAAREPPPVHLSLSTLFGDYNWCLDSFFNSQRTCIVPITTPPERAMACAREENTHYG